MSYSQRDKAWAKWLQGSLEDYRIDHDLVGRQTPAGSVPRTLRPIFRSRERIAADRSLSDRTLAALRASEYLVVLCSPNAAKSRHVNEEIRRFTSLGRADRVIPVIVDGEPGDPERECLPPALRFTLGPDRPMIDRRGEPAAAEARLARDGKERVKHKVVAAVLCLGLDEIERLAREAHKWNLRIRCSGVVAALLALTLACDGGFAWARYQLSHNETLLDRTLAHATALTSNAVAASEQVGVPRSVSARILEEAEDLFRGLAGLGQQTPQLRFRKASMLIEFARMHATLGNAELLQARAAEADRLMQRLAADVPGNLVWRQGFAVNYDRLGAALQAQGRFKEARASYQVSLAIAERLASDPGNVDRQHELAVRYLKVGDVDLDQGALGEAHAKYHSSLVIAEHLAAVDSGNARWQHDLLLAHERIADVARLQGERDAALAGYRESRALAERLVAGDPGNAEWQRALSVSHVKIGDVLTLQGKPDEALASYRAAHAIAGRLAAADPGNDGRQKDLGDGHERMGSVLEALGEVDAALAEYRASLAIARRLAAADPGNTGWQRDLGVAHEHIGDILRSRGDLAGALKHYEAKRAIVQRLAAADPDHAGWQYHLGTSHARVGFVLEAQGDFEAALREYEACLEIGIRFAAADPGNAASQRDLAVSYGKLAAVRHRLGKSGQALAGLRKGRDIMAALLATTADVEQWTQDLARFDGRIAALEGRGQALAENGPATGSPTVASAAGDPRDPRNEGLRAALRLLPKL